MVMIIAATRIVCPKLLDLYKVPTFVGTVLIISDTVRRNHEPDALRE